MSYSDLLRAVVANQVPQQFILDLHPDAAGAYSLRHLSSSYTGDVILVRRSSDNAEQGFTPTEITDGTLESFCGAGDGFVKTWYDQSGNAKDIEAESSGDQPPIIESGTLVTLNSQPSLSIDGHFMGIGSLVPSDYSELSMFGVFQQNSTSQASTMYFFRGVRPSGSQGIRPSPDATLRFDDGFFSWNTSWNNGIQIRSTIKNNTVYNEWSNSSHVIDNENRGSESQRSNNFFIGGTTSTFKATGFLSELIIYPNQKTSDQNEIEQLINTYYNAF